MKPNRNILSTYGINGSIRKRLDHQTQNTDYYYFNASGNLKACGTDMQISVYGYNSANTRTYKVNLFNANQWVNGQPQPIQPMVQSAMFYPNTYLNFTQAGEYTKHYYNGTERICSRLGEQQISISVENNQELEVYQHDVKQIIYNAIGQHLYDEPTNMQEGDVIPLEFLQPCGNNNAVYYYHPNHLGSTSFVTDMQQSVVQSFLYAPYGEIISEYNTHVMGEAFPKYAFNAKELDEETGMYYYEARYYKPPVFTSRDPMMEQKPWLSPYHYCSNNPVGRIDPTGCEDGDYYDKNGKYLGNDGIDDNKVYQLKAEYRAKFENTDVNWGGTLSEKHYTELQAKSNYLGHVQNAFVTGDPISDKRIQSLHPAIRMQTTNFIKEANANSNGTLIRVAQGFRTYAEQDALYAQGRISPGCIVTKAKGGYSNHNFGLAFDIVGITKGKIDYNLNWEYLSKLGKSNGFEWGGDWKFKDMPHFENMHGNSLEELRALPKDNNGLPILKP